MVLRHRLPLKSLVCFHITAYLQLHMFVKKDEVQRLFANVKPLEDESGKVKDQPSSSTNDEAISALAWDG